jgi:hypothetical protein
MGELETACRTVVEKVDGAVACGVVDLRSGFLLGGYEVEPSDATNSSRLPCWIFFAVPRFQASRTS